MSFNIPDIVFRMNQKNVFSNVISRDGLFDTIRVNNLLSGISKLNVTLVDDSEEIEREIVVYLTDTNINAANIILSLPEIINNGEEHYIKNTNNDFVPYVTTISAFDGNTISSSTSIDLVSGEKIHIVSYGTNWYAI